jgi:hypothetical protein
MQEVFIMKKRSVIKMVAFVLALALFMSIGAGSVFAQEQSGGQKQESSFNNFGSSLHKGFGIISGMIEKMFGLNREEIRSEIQEGKSLALIAEEKNIDTQEIEQAIIENRRERFQQAVQKGCLTSEQAEQRLRFMQEKIQQRMSNRSMSGNRFGFGCNR